MTWRECMVMDKLTEKQKAKIVTKFHAVVMELINELDSPETIYLMARALSLTAIMKAEKDFYGFLTMQNALNDAAQELIAMDLGEEPTQDDLLFEGIVKKDDKPKIH